MSRTDWKGLCQELLADYEQHLYRSELIDRARALLAQPEPEAVAADTDAILALAAIIREVDGSHTLGAAALAEAILSHPSSRWGRPAPAPAGEVAELVLWLRMQGEAQKPGPNSLLSDRTKNERHAAGMKLIRAAALLERQVAPVPVAVSERPWERDGWCDEQGQCWMGDPGGGGFIPSWRLCRPEDAPRMRVSLPFNALPLPSGEVE